jgi:hypothetical protein
VIVYVAAGDLTHNRRIGFSSAELFLNGNIVIIRFTTLIIQNFRLHIIEILDLHFYGTYPRNCLASFKCVPTP